MQQLGIFMLHGVCGLMLAAASALAAEQPKPPAKPPSQMTFGSPGGGSFGAQGGQGAPAPSSQIFGGANVWETIQAQTAPLVFRGTGSLGMSDTLKNWDTVQAQTAPLVFRGNGSLGLSDTLKNWDTVQVQTAPLVFRGTGQLK